MSSLLIAGPPSVSAQPVLHRFSVDQYHRMIETGILKEDERVELLEGHVVMKIPHNPLHDGTIQLTQRQLSRLLPAGWDTRIQSAIDAGTSEPEPDVAVVRGNGKTYLTRRPGAADLGLTVEVSESSLQQDRNDKCRIYARAGIPFYSIVNLVDHWIEVYSVPSGDAYSQHQDYPSGTSVPLVLDGIVVGVVPVDELLP